MITHIAYALVGIIAVHLVGFVFSRVAMHKMVRRGLLKPFALIAFPGTIIYYLVYIAAGLYVFLQIEGSLGAQLALVWSSVFGVALVHALLRVQKAYKPMKSLAWRETSDAKLAHAVEMLKKNK